MRRRRFIGALGGIVALRTNIADTQTSGRLPRVGALMFGTPTKDIVFSAFREALSKLGWRDGRTVTLDVRWSGDNAMQFAADASELVTLAPDVILTSASPAVAAALHATGKIPIVFAGVTDPVGQGFVANIARPGGNVTGFTNYEPEISTKWLALLKEIVPGITRVAVMFNPPSAPQIEFFLRSIEPAAISLGITALRTPVNDVSEIENGMAIFTKEANGGLVVLPDFFVAGPVHSDQVIDAALRHRLPAIYPYGIEARRGGLVAYGVDIFDVFRRAADYVDRILRGAHPADLPVQAPTKYELVINLKTARALGLTVPQTLLATADEVVE